MADTFTLWTNEDVPFDNLVVLTPEKIVVANIDLQSLRSLSKEGFALTSVRSVPGYRELDFSTIVYITTQTHSSKVHFMTAETLQNRWSPPFTVEMKDFAERDKLLATIRSYQGDTFQPHRKAPSFQDAFWEINEKVIYTVVTVVIITSLAGYFLQQVQPAHIRAQVPAIVAILLIWFIAAVTAFANLTLTGQFGTGIGLAFCFFAYLVSRTLNTSYEVSFLRKGSPPPRYDE